MRLVLLASVLVLLVAAAIWLYVSQHPKHKRWVVYYAAELPYSAFYDYDLVVFDSDQYPKFQGNRKHGQVILGYLSTSEAEEYRSYYTDIQQMGLLMEASDTWPDHKFIDIRNEQWRDYIVNTLVPHVLEQGFDGVMLDTIDTAIYLEEREPKRFAGMKDAAIALIRAIHKRYPDCLIMLNRGFPILEDVAPYLDYTLAESIRVKYDFTTKQSERFPDSVYAEMVGIVRVAQKVNPDLQAMSLDYWPMHMEENKNIRSIYAEQRAHGFMPYVTTADLSQLHQEP